MCFLFFRHTFGFFYTLLFFYFLWVCLCSCYGVTERNIEKLLNEAYTPQDELETVQETYLTPDVVLNVRSGAGTNFDRIGAIHPGMAFTVLDETNGWYQITYNDGTGYVSGEYVTLGGEDAERDGGI